MGQGEIADESALKGMGDSGIGIITAFHYDYNHVSAKNKEFVAAMRNTNVTPIFFSRRL